MLSYAIAYLAIFSHRAITPNLAFLSVSGPLLPIDPRALHFTLNGETRISVNNAPAGGSDGLLNLTNCNSRNERVRVA